MSYAVTLLREILNRITSIETDLAALTQAQRARKRPGRQPLELPDKTCSVCGAAFNRTRYPTGGLETSTAYAQRSTCSAPTCRSTLAARNSTQKRARTRVPPKPCGVCGTPITQGPKEPPARFAARKTCSNACSNASRSRAQQANHAARVAARPKPAQPPPPPPAAPIAPTPRAHRKRTWTEPENDILRNTYPTHGITTTHKTLADAGFTRTRQATITQISRLGLNRAPTGPATVLEVIRDYRGLPLGVDDICDELHLPRRAARALLEDLTQRGVIATRPNPDHPRAAPLYYAPTEDTA